MQQPEMTQEYIQQFVMVGHGNLEAVKEKLAQDPRLLDAMFVAWGETALGAASHVGRRDIAEYLLEQGAKMTICTAAMMGMRDVVADYLREDSSQANAQGAHGLTVLYHAAISGDTELTEMLYEHGGRDGLSNALIPAASHGRVEMVRWLLNKEADTDVTNFQGKTPLEIAEAKGYTEIAELFQA